MSLEDVEYHYRILVNGEASALSSIRQKFIGKCKQNGNNKFWTTAKMGAFYSNLKSAVF